MYGNNNQAFTLPTYQIDGHNEIVGLLVLLLLALLLYSHSRLCHRLDLALGLGSGSVLLSWRSAFHRMRSRLCRSFLAVGRFITLPRAVAQMATSIGRLIAGLKRQLNTD